MRRALVISALPAVRAGLRSLIGAQPGWSVVGEADRPEAALDLDLSPDVVVLDVEPGGEIGLALGAFGLDGPGLIVLGPAADGHRLPLELAGRPWGYLPREVGTEQLGAALVAVASGMLAVDATLGAQIMVRGSVGGDVAAAGEGEDLTQREREVLGLVALGLPNKTIARRLKISEHTVKFHVASLLAKLGAASRTEAVHLGARRGLVAL